MPAELDFDTVLANLSKPFHVTDVEWKPGALNKDRTRALALAYVETRAYIARLNEVVGEKWSDRYEVISLPDRISVICYLTVCGVTRTGDGEAMNGDGEGSDPNLVTSASAQAFKRACVKFGLGAYLYDLPQAWCDYDPQARRIVNPPKLPKWAVPEEEWEAYNAPQAKPAPAQAKPATTPAQPMPASAPRLMTAAEMQTAAKELLDSSSVVVHFGRYNGKNLAEIEALGKEGKGWLNWAATVFQPKTEADRALQQAVKAYISGGGNGAVNAAELLGFDDDEDIPF